MQVDIGDNDKIYVYLKYDYCKNVVKRDVRRMKEYNFCSYKNVASCVKVSEIIKEEIRSYMKKSTLSKDFV